MFHNCLSQQHQLRINMGSVLLSQVIMRLYYSKHEHSFKVNGHVHMSTKCNHF